MKQSEKSDTGPGCRAEAIGLRAMAEQFGRHGVRARMLQKADEWDARAVICETAEAADPTPKPPETVGDPPLDNVKSEVGETRPPLFGQE